MTNIDETQFARAVHELLLCLNSKGIALYQLPAPHSVEGADAVQALKAASGSFAQSKDISEAGAHLLLNYLADHLYEPVAEGVRRVSVNKENMARVEPHASDA